MGNAHSPIGPSPELIKAQERLERIRKEYSVEKEALGLQWAPSELGSAATECPSLIDVGQAELAERRKRAGINPWKAPISGAGWASKLETKQHRAKAAKVSKSVTRSVKAYPTILNALLKHGLVAPGRIYFLLRSMDVQGRGWVAIDEARAWLTQNGSPQRVCTWRRLRQILPEGEGILWRRDDERIWLLAPQKQAVALDIGPLKGLPIELPLKVLLGGIGAVRAHFYASYHSGRRRPAPISRQTLEEITGVPERTQREYDRLAMVKRHSNIAVGEQQSKENLEKRAWLHGHAMFRFVDHQGVQGKKNQEYIAWHLPNTYEGPHKTRPKGRQKKINRQMKDLVMKGMRGNEQKSRFLRLFWPNGALAGRAYNTSQDYDAYWEHNHSRGKHCLLWRLLPGSRT